MTDSREAVTSRPMISFRKVQEIEAAATRFSSDPLGTISVEVGDVLALCGWARIFVDPEGLRHQRDKYRDEAHLLTTERDAAIELLRRAEARLRIYDPNASGRIADEIKRFLNAE